MVFLLVVFVWVVEILGVLVEVEGVVFSMVTTFFAISLTLVIFDVLFVALALAEGVSMVAVVCAVAVPCS